MLLFIASTQYSYALQLNSDSQIATAGYYQLSWTGKSKNLQLQESNQPDFNSRKILYQGPDRARVISGQSDGDYYYRISSTDKNKIDFSNVIKVTVRHHPLENAIMFFIAGFIVFMAILVLIINGKRLET